ncbi:ROK family transcriptional regulator [Acidothermaceae bacterium B102]|nr:ROK family transcriptional regulator [Acidothermaceae bacterium B102]
MSSATVTQIVKRFLELGLVQELEMAPSRGGRPGKLLGLVGSAGRAIGVKVAADHLAIVDVQLDGTMLSRQTVDFDGVAPDVAGRLAAVLQPIVAERSSAPLLGVGVAVPGIVDSPDTGNVEAAGIGWSGLPLGRHLRGALGIPILVENDVNAVAVAELLYGRGRARQDFLVVTIGRGVGLAVVAGGALYRGARGGAGEFGHFPSMVDGPTCACGNKGCLEAVIGDAALLVAARLAGVPHSVKDTGRLRQLADRRDKAACGVFAEAGRLLGTAVAALVNALNPEAVFILGEGTSAWLHWDDAFRQAFTQHVPTFARHTPIEIEPWDDMSWAQGAAALVLATPFDVVGLAGGQADHVLARLHGQAIA